MFCNQCGTQIIDGAEFCSKCGQPINASAPINPNSITNLDPVQIKSIFSGFSKIFLIFFGTFGIIVCGVIFFNYLRADATKHWPQTQGVVIKTSVRQYWAVSNTSTGTSYHNNFNTNFNNNYNTNYNTQTQKTLMYSPQVLYQYSVGAQNFTSSKVSYFNPSSSSEADIDVIIDRYPAGKQVTVYYNPQKPSEAVLEPG